VTASREDEHCSHARGGVNWTRALLLLFVPGERLSGVDPDTCLPTGAGALLNVRIPAKATAEAALLHGTRLSESSGCPDFQASHEKQHDEEG
jgi:hypothetical protein